MLDKTYNLLTLDPMYSSLHEKIANQVAIKKYAVTSCWAKKVYLPSFKFTLAATLINDFIGNVDKSTLDKITTLPTYHHSYVKKIEERALSVDEVNYMGKFYLALKKFINDKAINLVIVHNDTRWYHAIAILICKELNIKYLVTEQGLIRPYTTVIDNKGVNATANNDFINKKVAEKPTLNFKPKCTHDSKVSMFFFFFFISFFSIERLIKSKSILRYMHNDYHLRKYKQRFITRFTSKNIPEQKLALNDNSALLVLQLERDSQFLMYSKYQNNQEVINKVQAKCKQLNLSLAIKKHPLDHLDYQLDESSYLVCGEVAKLSEQAKLVIAVNSSAILTVLTTKTPLFIVGESLYHYKAMAEHTSIEAINLSKSQCNEDRFYFYEKLKQNYLLLGAGYSFNTKMLTYKLKELLDG